jgi:hypothetical protein
MAGLSYILVSPWPHPLPYTYVDIRSCTQPVETETSNKVMNNDNYCLCFSVRLPVCQSDSMSVCVCLSVCCLSICLSVVCLLVCLYIQLSQNLTYLVLMKKSL